MELCTSKGMATKSTSTMATPMAAPMTLFLRLSLEAARVKKSSSLLEVMMEVSLESKTTRMEVSPEVSLE